MIYSPGKYSHCFVATLSGVSCIKILLHYMHTWNYYNIANQFKKITNLLIMPRSKVCLVKAIVFPVVM